MNVFQLLHTDHTEGRALMSLGQLKKVKLKADEIEVDGDIGGWGVGSADDRMIKLVGSTSGSSYLFSLDLKTRSLEKQTDLGICGECRVDDDRNRCSVEGVAIKGDCMVLKTRCYLRDCSQHITTAWKQGKLLGTISKLKFRFPEYDLPMKFNSEFVVFRSDDRKFTMIPGSRFKTTN